MSEERIPDVSFTRCVRQKRACLLASEQGKIQNDYVKVSTRFELYGAYQFARRLDGKHWSSNVPALRSRRVEFYKTMFRLRIDGCWYCPGGRRYEFFGLDTILGIMGDC